MHPSEGPAASADTSSAAPPHTKDHPDWAELLSEAVSKPGVVSDAYSRFWNYSVGNQILAIWQCAVRDIEPGPIHTFKGWLDLGRHVKRGERAITLCMPVQVRRKPTDKLPGMSPIRVGDGAERQITGAGGAVAPSDDTATITVFTYKPHWFVLAQTDGAEYVPAEMPQWSESEALHRLTIDRVQFRHPDGNCQGYAVGREVAISPIAVLPRKTLFHELAHIVLGHTEEGSLLDDHEQTPGNLREVEAESVAYLCCESLRLIGGAESRGYIQHWLRSQTIPDRSAQKIFRAADRILKAGYPKDRPGPADAP